MYFTNKKNHYLRTDNVSLIDIITLIIYEKLSKDTHLKFVLDDT